MGSDNPKAPVMTADKLAGDFVADLFTNGFNTTVAADKLSDLITAYGAAQDGKVLEILREFHHADFGPDGEPLGAADAAEVAVAAYGHLQHQVSALEEENARLLFTSDKQSAAWKARALKAEAELAALRAKEASKANE